MGHFVCRSSSPNSLAVRCGCLSRNGSIARGHAIFIKRDRCCVALGSSVPARAFLLNGPFVDQLGVGGFLRIGRGIDDIGIRMRGRLKNVRRRAMDGSTSANGTAAVTPVRTFCITAGSTTDGRVALLLAPRVVNKDGGTARRDGPTRTGKLGIYIRDLGARDGSTTVLIVRGSRATCSISSNSSFGGSMLIPALLSDRIGSPLGMFNVRRDRTCSVLPVANTASLKVYLSRGSDVHVRMGPVRNISVDKCILRSVLSNTSCSLSSPLVVTSTRASLNEFIVEDHCKDASIASISASRHVDVIRRNSSILIRSTSNLLGDIGIVSLGNEVVDEMRKGNSEYLGTDVTANVRVVRVRLASNDDGSCGVVFWIGSR